MVDILDEKILRVYDESKKVEKKLEDFALITTKDEDDYHQTEVILNGESLENIIKNHTSDMVSVVFYSRPVGLYDDFVVYGPMMNVGMFIYFGKKTSVYKYNETHEDKLSLPMDNQVIELECGDVLDDFESVSKTHSEVLEDLNRIRKSLKM